MLQYSVLELHFFYLLVILLSKLQRDVRSREQEIMRKGIERLEKEILHYINVHLPKDQINIALVKKCKTTDIPAVKAYRKHTESNA